MVTGLADRLANEGGDGPAWARLAQAQTVIGDTESAARSYAKARSLSPDDPEILKAEAIFHLAPPPKADGFPIVSDAARANFEAVRRLDPADPEPLWYLGIRALQDGDRDRAAALWRDLLGRLPKDHPDRPAIEARLKDLGVKANG